MYSVNGADVCCPGGWHVLETKQSGVSVGSATETCENYSVAFGGLARIKAIRDGDPAPDPAPAFADADADAHHWMDHVESVLSVDCRRGADSGLFPVGSRTMTNLVMAAAVPASPLQ
ncbi:hypothetical protein UVI_02042890 [Ustilaginoidea virens]|uniref:Uncharacterized protein n=1 Tax=Ustilaginoidea virens TaxID=1159556 RepID=A0A1B5L3H4_USTVR|nr:hypothetical protein UVI_02042890 [Ustilaginoidea virens]